MATAGLAVLALVAGSAAGIAALTSAESRVVTAAGRHSVVGVPAAEVPPRPPAGDSALGAEAPGHAVAEAEQAEAEQMVGGDRSAPGEADRTATRGPRRAVSPDRQQDRGSAVAPARDDSPAVASTPEVRTELISETEVIPFRTRLIHDPSLPRGSKRIQSEGVPGERLLRYEVTYTGTTETGRRLLDATVTRRPQRRVVAFGDRRGSTSQQGGSGRDQRGECQLTVESCVDLGRSAGCVGDPAETRPENIVDGDLSLLEPADLDELELTLPCVDEPAP